MKQEILKGGSDALALGLMDHGRPVAPSSCTIRILNGGTILEEGAAASGLFTPSAAVTAEIHEDLTAEWTFAVAGGKTQRRVELFDVVLFKLFPVVTDQDLIREVASLGSADYGYRGTVTSSEAQSLVDRGLIGAHEDWLGAVLAFTSGAESGKQYIIAGFDPITGEIEYAGTTPPAAGDGFLLRRSYQGELDSAWEDIYDKLIQSCSSAPDGSRPALIMSPDRLRRPHLLRTLEKIFRGLADDMAGADWGRAEHYAAEFESAWNGLALVFAAPSSTTPAPSHEGTAQFGFGR